MLLFAFFFVHNILPQAKEGVLSPHFNVETIIGILFIDRPIRIDMFVLVKKSCSQASFGTPFAERRARCAYTAIHSRSDVHRKRAYDCCCLNLRCYCVVFVISKILQTKIKEKVSGSVIF